MTVSDTGQTAGRRATRKTAHLSIHYDSRSYAGQVVDAIAERAEAAYQRGWEWFFGDQERPTITVSLTNLIEDVRQDGLIRTATALAAPAHRSVWLLVSPESPGLGLEETVVELLARAAGAERSAGLAALLSALGGLIAAGRGVGLTEADADRLAHEHYAARKRPARLFAAGREPVPGAPHAGDVSFLLFLERAYGPPALARFARAALSQTPEE